MSTRSVFDRLAGVYAPVALAVFAIVLAVLTVVAIRFRASAGSTPSTRVASQKLELGYTGVLVVVAGLLLWQTYAAMQDIDPVAERTAAAAQAGPAGLTVGVVASRWNWRFSYPGGVVQTGDGRERFADLVVPADRAVRFRMTAQDVEHAFWIPALRYKFDAVPGQVNVFDLRFARGLDYSTARCSEFCGEYHDQMRFRVQALAPAAFDRWLQARQAAVR